MYARTDTKLYEDIIHVTDSAPYSLHHTRLPADCLPSLYLHWHKEMEFLALHQGKLRFQIEDREFVLQEGDGIFIPPTLLHNAENTGGTEVSFSAFVLSPSFLIADFDTNAYNQYILPVLHNNLHFAVPLRQNVPWQASLLEHLSTIFSTNTSQELFVRGHALLIWSLLYNYHISQIGGKHSFSSLAEHLAPALCYIQAHYTEAISLDTLASCVHLSEGQFCRTFKLLTGMTPFHYLNRYRILQSCHDLYHTNKRITEIAFSHGFNNVSYYNRAFLKLMSMTPSAYRKRRNCQF